MTRTFDTVIKGGTIVDGMRTPRFVSDIGIRGGRIAYIGNIRDTGGARVIDAANLVVAPGIIDLHTHYDSQIFWDPWCTISGWHGVTSVVACNCGFGFAPCKPEDRERAMLIMARNEAIPVKTQKAGMPWDWITFPQYMDSLERTPKGLNIACYAPLSPMLMYVMGKENAKSRSATTAERAQLRTVFSEALAAGACGFSAQYTGTENPQRDSDGTPMITDVMAHEDLMLFAEVLRERGEGIIQMICAPAVAEELATVSGRPVLWNALSAGPDQHGTTMLPHREIIQWLNDANARGLRIFGQSETSDVSFMFSMEDWNLFDGHPTWREITLGSAREKLRKMSDPRMREILRNEYDAGKGPIAGGKGFADDNAAGRAGIERLFIIGPRTPKYQQYEGFRVGELAQALNKHPMDAFLDLVVDENLQTDFQAETIEVNPESMKEVVLAPLSLPGLSDGGAHTKFITTGAYGTDYLVQHCRERRTVDLEEAHWRLSGYCAYAAGIADRGVLREGMAADIIVYDFDELRTTAPETVRDFPADEWRRVKRAVGYRYVLVNGEVTFIDGQCTGATPGTVLRNGRASERSSVSGRPANMSDGPRAPALG